MQQLSNASKKEELIKLVHEFDEFHGDELDACHPDAYDVIYEIDSQKDDLSLDEITELLNEFNLEFGQELEDCNDDGFEYFKRNISPLIS